MKPEPTEVLYEFFVVEAHEDEGVAFLADEVVDLRIVIAFVLAAKDEDRRCGHGLEGIPAGVDIGGLGVVDETDTADGGHVLETMRDALERHEALADDLFLDTDDVSGYRSCHRIEDVMPSFERQLVFADRQRVGLRETVGIECGTEVERLQTPVDDGIFRPIDESIVRRLVARDAELGIDVVLELKIVAVQVVRRYIEQDGDVRLEIVHVVELERTQFDDVVVMLLAGDLQGERVADIAGEADVEACVAEDIVDKGGGRGLAVRTGDADHLGVGVAGRELNFGDDMKTEPLSGSPLRGEGALIFSQLLEDGGIEWDAGGFDVLVGIFDALESVSAVFPWDGVLVEKGAIRFGDSAAVRDKDIEAFLFGKDGGAGAGFASS